MMLNAEDDIMVVGEADDGAAAVALAASARPDVVLMDIRMPGPDGLAAGRDDPSPSTPCDVRPALPCCAMFALTLITLDRPSPAC